MNELLIDTLYQLLLKYPNGLDNRGWDVEGLSKNKYLSPQYILDHLDLPWNWDLICKNILLTDEFFEDFSDHIIWKSISINESLTEEMIEKYWEKLNYYYLSSNQALTHRIIDKYTVRQKYDNIDDIKEKSQGDVVCIDRECKIGDVIFSGTIYSSPFDWYDILLDSDPSLETIEQFDEIWDSSHFIDHYDSDSWYLVSSNQYLPITRRFLEKYKEQLNWSYISRNYNLTAEMIQAMIDNPDEYGIYGTDFKEINNNLIYLEDAENIIEIYGDKLDTEIYDNHKLLIGMTLEETLIYIRENNYNWDQWYQLCKKCRVGYEISFRFLYLPDCDQLGVNWDEASRSTDIDILELYRYNWNYEILSSVAPVEFITAYPELPWDSKILSSREYYPSIRSLKSAR